MPPRLAGPTKGINILINLELIGLIGRRSMIAGINKAS
jgi:hypothetical protein